MAGTYKEIRSPGDCRSREIEGLWTGLTRRTNSSIRVTPRRSNSPLRNTHYFLLPPSICPKRTCELHYACRNKASSDARPNAQSAMRHSEKKGGLFWGAERILKPSHSANMREFRPMPTAPKAMRHIGQPATKGGSRGLSMCLIFSNRLTRLRPSRDSQKTENHPPTLVTLNRYQAPRAPTRKAY